MTYAQLKTDVADTLKRSDLTDAIPRLISYAHTEIDNEIRGPIREDDRILTVANGVASLPTDFRKLLNIEYEGRVLRPAGRRAFDGLTDTGGEPSYYRIVHGQIELFPAGASSSEISILYERSIPALDRDTDTNEILERFPALYLYGALKHSAPYLVEDQRLPVWIALYSEQLDKANKQLKAEKHPASFKMSPVGAVV